jgi:hypothetical protein
MKYDMSGVYEWQKWRFSPTHLEIDMAEIRLAYLLKV